MSYFISKQSSPPQPAGFNSFIYSIWRYVPEGPSRTICSLSAFCLMGRAKRRSDTDSEEAALANRGEVRTVSDNTWKPLLSWVFPSVRALGIALLFLRLHQIQISTASYGEKMKNAFFMFLVHTWWHKSVHTKCYRLNHIISSGKLREPFEHCCYIDFYYVFM